MPHRPFTRGWAPSLLPAFWLPVSLCVSHPLANTHQLSPLKPKSKISPEAHTVGGLAAPAPLPLSLHVSSCKTYTPVELFLKSPPCVHADIKTPITVQWVAQGQDAGMLCPRCSQGTGHMNAGNSAPSFWAEVGERLGK